MNEGPLSSISKSFTHYKQPWKFPLEATLILKHIGNVLGAYLVQFQCLFPNANNHKYLLEATLIMKHTCNELGAHSIQSHNLLSTTQNLKSSIWKLH
jgi:hypothetical protein